MQILVFKTNMRYKKNVNEIRHVMEVEGILRWNVDLKDRDKILRVVSKDCQPQKIEGIIKQAGYTCEELKD